MAWRLGASVTHGFIDNCEKGRVFGELHLIDQDEPIIFELSGNCYRDIAGCRLSFTNHSPVQENQNWEGFSFWQNGIVGDITASRKVKVFDVSLNEALKMKHEGNNPPAHFANSIYLEWFGDKNGRCVVELADFKASISAASWVMAEEEEERQKELNHEAYSRFLATMGQQIDYGRERLAQLPEGLDEFQWEQVFRHVDLLTDRSMEIMGKSIDLGGNENSLEELLENDEKDTFNTVEAN